MDPHHPDCRRHGFGRHLVAPRSSAILRKPGAGESRPAKSYLDIAIGGASGVVAKHPIDVNLKTRGERQRIIINAARSALAAPREPTPLQQPRQCDGACPTWD
jgi:hypothetical protein